eukprot:gene34404-44140_t
MVAPAEETFEQELERVLIEQTAISQEQAASHTAFSLPALNLKYKGSDMYFEKDFGATLTPKHGPAGATTGVSGIPKLPAIAGASAAPTGMAKLFGGLLRPSEETNANEQNDHDREHDNDKDNNEPRHEAEGSNDDGDGCCSTWQPQSSCAAGQSFSLRLSTEESWDAACRSSGDDDEA